MQSLWSFIVHPDRSSVEEPFASRALDWYIGLRSVGLFGFVAKVERNVSNSQWKCITCLSLLLTRAIILLMGVSRMSLKPRISRWISWVSSIPSINISLIVESVKSILFLQLHCVYNCKFQLYLLPRKQICETVHHVLGAYSLGVSLVFRSCIQELGIPNSSTIMNIRLTRRMSYSYVFVPHRVNSCTKSHSVQE